MLKIYGSDISVFSNKVRYTANAMGLEYEYQPMNIPAGDTQKPEYLRIHPAGKVPAMDDDGFILFESNAICKYLADKNGSELYPKELKQRSVVDQWVDFSTLHVSNAVNRLLFNRVLAPLIGMAVDEQSIKDGINFVARFLPIVDKQLEVKNYFASGQMTLADVCLLASLDPVEISDIDISSYQNIVRWRNALKQEKFYKDCFDEYGEPLRAMMAES